MLVAAVVARNPKSEIVRASYSENGIGENARPHPGPLPQERTPRTLNAHCTLEPPEAPPPRPPRTPPPPGGKDGVKRGKSRREPSQVAESSSPSDLAWSQGPGSGCATGPRIRPS